MEVHENQLADGTPHTDTPLKAAIPQGGYDRLLNEGELSDLKVKFSEVCRSPGGPQPQVEEQREGAETGTNAVPSAELDVIQEDPCPFSPSRLKYVLPSSAHILSSIRTLLACLSLTIIVLHMLPETPS